MVLSRRTIYTIITPLPPQITRETVLAAFRDHGLMIELNPLVIKHFPVKPPRFAPADEYHSPWYEIHDKVNYTRGGTIHGRVVYHACLHDLPAGLQTHCYAALGTDIRGKWLLCGSLPGEPAQVRELGIDAPQQGLYIREDIDMKTNIFMTGIVKKNLANAHQELLQRLIIGVGIVDSLPPPIATVQDSPLAMTRPATAAVTSQKASKNTSRRHSRTTSLRGPRSFEPERERPMGYVSIVPSAPLVSPLLARQSMRNVMQRRTKSAMPASPMSTPSVSSRASTPRPSGDLDSPSAETATDLTSQMDDDRSASMTRVSEANVSNGPGGTKKVDDWDSRLVHHDAKPQPLDDQPRASSHDPSATPRISEESFCLDIPMRRSERVPQETGNGRTRRRILG